MLSKESSKSNLVRFGSISSKHPAFIKLSTHFLLTLSPETRSQKSIKLVYLPKFFLDVIISLIAFSPAFFIELKANLILPFITENLR